MRAIFVFLLFTTKVYSESCSLDVSDPESPFIVNEDLEFPNYAVDQTFIFEEEDLLYVVCPKGTHSPFVAEKGDRMDCKGGTSLLDLKTTDIIDFLNIKCKPDDVTTVKKSDENCANGSGTIFEIGFVVFLDFLSMITVCFDEEKLTPIYSKYHNDFYEESISRSLLRADIDPNYYENFVCNATDCGWTDSGSLFSTVILDDLYDNQATILKNLSISNVSIPLTRFPLTTALWYLNVDNSGQEIQKAPYYDYMNVVPAWNSDILNELFYVLDTAIGNGDFYLGSKMYTGGLGVATLPNDDGDEVELYLSGDQIPVPRWFWMVWDQKEQIFFYYNNPSSEKSENAIGEVCSQHNNLSTNMFTCSYIAIIDPDMKNLIDNDFS